MTKDQLKEVVLLTCYYSEFDNIVTPGLREDADICNHLSDETAAALVKLLKKEKA